MRSNGSVLVVHPGEVPEPIDSTLKSAVVDVMDRREASDASTDVGIEGVECVVAVLDGSADPIVASRNDFDVPIVAVATDGTSASAALQAGATEYVRLEDVPALLPRRIESALRADRPVIADDLRRTIVENVPLVLFAFDAEGTFTLSQGEGLASLGLEPGEVVGESVFDVYADHDRIVEYCRRALEGERIDATVEVDGLVFETWFRPIRDGAEVAGVVGAALDVTERAERERELTQYETIVETVPDGVFVLDEEGTIVECNERSAELFGYEREEIEGGPFAKMVEDGVVDESVMGEYVDAVRRLISSEYDDDRERHELTITRPDGSERVLEAHLALRPYEEDYRGTIGVIRDVTERRAYERELERQNERLEEFASIVSHDLRNPLNVAQGRIELLLEAAREGSDEVTEEEAAHVADALDRMAEIIDDVLALARTGGTVEETEPVAIDAVARDAWRTVETKDATLRIEGEVAVTADRERLRRLFENLFANAIEHAGADTTVRVGTSGDGVYVADDGPGIPEAERERVFESGYASGEGTGFGLTIVRRIAEAHGWTVTATESARSGARFEFSGVEFA